MSSKIPYTFSVLRYIPNQITGEFANIGVALRARWYMVCTIIESRDWDRLKVFFRDDDLGWESVQSCSIADRINALGDSMRDSEGGDIREIVDKILPPDSSAYQFGPSMGGVTRDPHARLEALSRYYCRGERP